MKDINTQIEHLAAEAAECEMIAKLTGDQAKRELFQRLAIQYRAMLEDLQQQPKDPK
jgi:hypothetical protein